MYYTYLEMHFCQQENKNNENGVSIVNVCERQRDRRREEWVEERGRQREGGREKQIGFVHVEVWLLHAIKSGCFDTV